MKFHPQALDTPPHIQAILIAGYRRMSCQAKLKRATDLSQTVQQLALARIWQQYRTNSVREQMLHLAALWLDQETLRRVMQWNPRRQTIYVQLSDSLQIIQQVIHTFEVLEIPYFIGGSLASSVHGIPRASVSADIVTDIQAQHIPGLVAALATDFYIDADMIQGAIDHQGSFNIIHLASMFKIDVFILKSDPLSQQEMATRQAYPITDNTEQTLFLARVENLIVQKLHWYQLSGQVLQTQWNDVSGILQVQHADLDYAYLRQAAQQRGVTDLLEQVLQQVGT